MITFRLHKLVRDKLLGMMQSAGQIVNSRVLDDAEYVQELRRKLLEETAEFDPSSDSALSELADLQEVLDQLLVTLGSNKQALLDLQHIKAQKSGGFAKKIFVETVTLADDDPWAKYYSAEPQRFPVVKD